MNALGEKFKEVLLSVAPITILVLVLHFSVTPLEGTLMVRFLLGAFTVIIGLSIFLLGVDLGVTPIGELMGPALTKPNKITVLVFGSLVVGFFISISELALHILGDEVELISQGAITKYTLVIVVSVGIAVMMSLGIFRIVRGISIKKMLIVLYAIVFILAFFVTPEYLAISFDASGATTGAMTVPFILAVAVGVSHMKKNSMESEADSFGLVAIASVGAIIAVMVMCVSSGANEITGAEEVALPVYDSIMAPFISSFTTSAFEVMVALAPLFFIFLAVNKFSAKLSGRSFRRIVFGLLYSYGGLVIFLTGVNAGFMEVGRVLGIALASRDSTFMVIFIGFVLGLATISAEPAVYVLTRQIEEVTSGYVKRSLVLPSLAIGVGAAIGLSVLRIVVPEIQLWHYLLPGYIISIGLMFVVPDLFVGMAFDSGGVASGPMTATFLMAYTQGAAQATPSANVIVDGFGMISMVALTPIITLQILGFLYKIKSAKGGMKDNE